MKSLGAAMLAAAVIASGVGAQDGGWRRTATQYDRERLRDWRKAWMSALDEMRGSGGGAAIAGDPALFDADHALPDGALPPAGDYRCRRLSIGERLPAGATALSRWGACRIEGSAAPRRLVVLDGPQRLVGLIRPDIDRRAVFLGTATFADERRPPDYGRVAGRDMPGWVERIGERRWRLALPYPAFGGALDLIELEPAA